MDQAFFPFYNFLRGNPGGVGYCTKFMTTSMKTLQAVTAVAVVLLTSLYIYILHICVIQSSLVFSVLPFFYLQKFHIFMYLDRYFSLPFYITVILRKLACQSSNKFRLFASTSLISLTLNSFIYLEIFEYEYTFICSLCLHSYSFYFHPYLCFKFDASHQVFIS